MKIKNKIVRYICLLKGHNWGLPVWGFAVGRDGAYKSATKICRRCRKVRNEKSFMKKEEYE